MRTAAALAFAALTGSCSLEDQPSAPARLADGSPARPPPLALEGVAQPTVLTKVRVVAAVPRDQRSATAACIRGRGRGARTEGIAVERIGTASETVTLRDASGRALVGCDGSPRGTEREGRRWCAGAYGLLVSGRLRDPRLSVLCSNAEGDPLAFAWVQPQSSARYVAVGQRGFVEVYEVAGGLPVRVSSDHGVDLARSSTTFRISEHDAAGALVRDYELRASVAG